jgi:septum formation protein
MRLYLASQSPRRAELLQQIRVPFEQFSVDLDESRFPHESASDYVQRLARAKAQAGYAQCQDETAWVLGADTVVVYRQYLFGKPDSPQEAQDMLQQLSGQRHQVMTAVAVAHKDQCYHQINISEVEFRPLTLAEIQAYIATGEPLDKAGAYAIQGLAASFICHLSGSYSAVMGLPLYETSQLLQQMGFSWL